MEKERFSGRSLFRDFLSGATKSTPVIEASNHVVTIGVDLGSDQIKTKNLIFPAGLVYHGSVEPDGDAYLGLDGHYYSLAVIHDSIEKNKTQSDRYYVLGLFAVVKELKLRYPNQKKFNINLAIGGLPTSMNHDYNLALKEYFTKNNPIDLFYAGEHYQIHIENFYIFPTGLAAIAASDNDIRLKNRFIIIDVGGGSTEFLVYKNQQLDRQSCFSVNEGTISINEEIMMNISMQYGYDVDQSEISDVLKGEDTLLPGECKQIVLDTYRNKALGMINRLRDYNLDPRTWFFFLTGGGARYVKAYFTRENGINGLYVDDNISANAIGLELLGQTEYLRSQKQ